MTEIVHTATDTGATDIATAAVPDIGDTFVHDGHRFVVTGWLRQVPLEPLPADLAELFAEVPAATPPLVFCPRGEAEYVTAYAGHGALVAVTQVAVAGRVDWPETHLAYARRRAALAEGRYVHGF